MLHTVFDKTTGHLMDVQHLLVSPKYKELLGRSYMKELGCLDQDMTRVSKGTNAIVFNRCEDIPHNRKCVVTNACRRPILLHTLQEYFWRA
jgi:hypothetical protein